MAEQSFAKHTKLVPMYHGVLIGLIMLTFIGAVVNFIKSVGDPERIYSASLILVMSVSAIIQWLFARVFPLKAQDRAIRAEENLRHFALTGKLLDKRLNVSQIIALRFASDAELPSLASKAAEQNLPNKAIKQEVRNWRADHDRL
jgi:uncharacterized protein DUF6526